MNPGAFATAVVHQHVVSALEKLAKLFHEQCKLAFVMWRPGMPECFMVIGDEPLSEAARVIQKATDGERLQEAEAEISLWREYEQFLFEQNSVPISIAAAHGWRCSPEVFERGREYRSRLKIERE